MGCGKSSLGKRLSKRLDMEFIDMDKAIEAEAGATIPEIFAAEGEESFRRRERQMLERLSSKEGDCIIATGGGAPCHEGTMEFINACGYSIYLRMPPSILTQRLCRHKEKRPLLTGMSDDEVAAFVTRTLAERETYYLRASISIDCENRSDYYIIDHLSRCLEMKMN